MISPDYCLMLDEIYEQEKEAATQRDDDDDGKDKRSGAKKDGLDN